MREAWEKGCTFFFYVVIAGIIVFVGAIVLG